MTGLAPLAVAPEQPVLAGLVDDDVGWAGCFDDDVWDLTPLLVRRRSAERLHFGHVPTSFRSPLPER